MLLVFLQENKNNRVKTRQNMRFLNFVESIKVEK